VLSGLLIHPKTEAALKSYLKEPTQVLAILGAEGAGKKHLSYKLAAELVGGAEGAAQAQIINIERPADKNETPILAIRDLIRRLRVKQPGALKRVVLINEADRLSPEAQNALLKTLEQPNPDTYFILGVQDAAKLLPTVFSRTQKIVIHPVSEAMAAAFYSGDYQQQKIKTAWLLSEGMPGQLSQLLANETEHPLRASMDAAKSFLSSSRYERLASLDSLAKDKGQLSDLLMGLARILKILHHSNIRGRKQQATSKILAARILVRESQTAIAANASAKAVLLKLILNLQV
jgi:hypothetical protein